MEGEEAGWNINAGLIRADSWVGPNLPYFFSSVILSEVEGSL
jgi:hypothetical protein